MAKTPPNPSPALGEAYYQSLIEDALDIITVTDRLGIIQYASPANRRVLGYDPEELIGKNAFLLVHPDDRLRCLKDWSTGLLRPEKISCDSISATITKTGPGARSKPWAATSTIRPVRRAWC